MKHHYLFYFFTIMLCLSGCSGSKKYYKKGVQLEAANMTEEAANMYLNSLSRNNRNIDAQIALKRTAQIVLDGKLGNVFKAHGSEDYKTAVYSFLEAKKYQEKVNYYNVKLSIPNHYQEYFNESKEKYLSSLYDEGVAFLEQDAFAKADQLFAEILSIEPNYKDVKELKNASTNEPIYRGGMTAFEAKNFKEAYRKFDLVVKKDKNYKDAFDMREKARKEATLTIGLLPFSNFSYTPNAQERFKANIISSLANMNHPFIEVVDRDNLQAIIDEQKLGMSGLIDEKSAAKVGELLGVKAVLIGKVVDFKHSTGQWQEQEKVGYESYFVKKLDTTTNKYVNEMRYRKVIYSEVSNSKQLNVSFQYQLVSSETGKILATNVINRRQDDAIRYASYSGDYRNLFPGNNQNVFTSTNDQNRLHSLFTSRRDFRSNEDLAQNIYEDIAKQVALEIKKHVETK